MKKANKTRRGTTARRKHPRGKADRDLLPEYDFRGGVRGKYAARYSEGTNVILLEPDVARLFPDSESVNRVLRACGEILRARRGAK